MGSDSGFDTRLQLGLSSSGSRQTFTKNSISDSIVIASHGSSTRQICVRAGDGWAGRHTAYDKASLAEMIEGGDSTGGPAPQRGSRGARPTLVVEAGDSETLEELRNEMRRWFESSDHQVKIVLLAKSDGISGEIILEKWVEAQAQAGPSGTGATTTPAVIRGAVAAQEAPQLVPDRSQVITITPDARVTDSLGYWNRFHSSAYAVAGGDLRLEFDCLFLRSLCELTAFRIVIDSPPSVEERLLS